MRHKERDLREIKKKIEDWEWETEKNGGERSERTWIERGEKG